MRPFRIGKIAYTNVLPVYQYLRDTDMPIAVEWVRQVPTELNRKMMEGSIEISPISSFAYAQQFSNCLLLPNLSISAWGAVRSILLFSKKDSLSALDGAKIALTTASSTSVHLLRVILEKFEGIQPEYQFVAPDLDKMLEQADAALLIGDDAIKASWRKSSYFVFDLGYEWYRRTGLSMTFAVWAIRREIVEERKAEIEQIAEVFLQAKAIGKNRLEPVIEEAQRRLGGSISFWNKYYQGLCYDLGEKELMGLKTFYHHAFDLGLLDEEVEVQLLEMPKACICNDRVK